MFEYKIDWRSDNRSTCEFWLHRWNKNKIQASGKLIFHHIFHCLYREAGWTSWTWSAATLVVSFRNWILCNNQAEITTSLDVRIDPSHLQLLSIFVDATFVLSVIKAAVRPLWCSLNALDFQLTAGGKV